MGISFVGTICAEVTSADIATLLANISHCGVIFRHVNYTDSLTVTVEINRLEYKIVKEYVARHGGSVRIIKKSGLYWRLKGFINRPFLIVGCAIVLLLISWIPTRVLFISVEGNTTIPSRLIIEQANLCGISFGASRREVRSEKMKNRLLGAIPSLQWAGINTNGCTAVISVRERTQKEADAEIHQVGSIVAVRDGIIESCTVQRGNPLCKIGQAVKNGDILISAYTDCGIKINATRAEGEVFAQTRHELTAYSPISYRQKGEATRIEKKYSILLGKKRINFYKGSGILGTSCDKIVNEYYLTLPGNFQLPIALLVTTTRVYDESMVVTATENAESEAISYMQQYLISQMISGRILRDVTLAQYASDVCVFRGEFICSEMIGRVQYEETIGNYGEDHGENR